MNETDILIIGCGIAGVSTAYHLSQYGRDVTLLERGDVASGASGVNAGNIGAIGWGNVPTLNSHLTMGSLEIFKRIQLGLGYDIEHLQCGGLQASKSEQQYQYAHDGVLGLKSQVYTGELLTPREAQIPARPNQADPDLQVAALSRSLDQLARRIRGYSFFYLPEHQSSKPQVAGHMRRIIPRAGAVAAYSIRQQHRVYTLAHGPCRRLSDEPVAKRTAKPLGFRRMVPEIWSARRCT